MIDVRAVGGGFRGRPELGRWRLQCGEEGEGLRAFGGCLTCFDVKACLSRGKFGSFGVLRAPVFDSSWLALPEVLFWGLLVLRGDCGRRGHGGCLRHRCSRVSLPVCVSVSAFR